MQAITRHKVEITRNKTKDFQQEFLDAQKLNMAQETERSKMQ